MLRLLIAGVEITVLSVILYYLILFLRGTGAVQALRGMLFLGLIVALSRILRLDVLFSIFARGLPFLFLAFVVIFQNELRRVLAELGRRRIFAGSSIEKEVIEEVAAAALELARKKIGGLIAIQRNIGLGDWVSSGVELNSKVTRQLLVSIFMPNGPLHDGGVIIEGNTIKAAACSFPLSRRRYASSEIGMRHKAALGLAQASDSLVIVVSEETGTVSVALRGRLFRNLEEEGLRQMLFRNIHFQESSGGAR